MVAVVTGAAGFIGRALVAKLAEAGPVLTIDRHPTPGLQLDLLDDDPALTRALSGATVVYHLAGCPDVRDPRPDADQHRYRDNVLATAAVLARVPLDVPLLVTSSSSIYGRTRDRRPSAESDRPRPCGGYGRSKVLVEQLCAARREAGGLVTVVRPFTVAGEGQRPGMAIAQWIDAARSGRPLRLLGDPRRTRDITDIRDVVRALIDLAARRVPGTVNVGTGVGHSLLDLATAVCEAVGVEPVIEHDRAHPAEVDHTLADTRRLYRHIGWVPETHLPALIRRQISSGSLVSAPTILQPKYG